MHFTVLLSVPVRVPVACPADERLIGVLKEPFQTNICGAGADGMLGATDPICYAPIGQLLLPVLGLAVHPKPQA